jgi:hypothetical protein
VEVLLEYEEAVFKGALFLLQVLQGVLQLLNLFRLLAFEALSY